VQQLSVTSSRNRLASMRVASPCLHQVVLVNNYKYIANLNNVIVSVRANFPQQTAPTDLAKMSIHVLNHPINAVIRIYDACIICTFVLPRSSSTCPYPLITHAYIYQRFAAGTLPRQVYEVCQQFGVRNVPPSRPRRGIQLLPAHSSTVSG